MGKGRWEDGPMGMDYPFLKAALFWYGWNAEKGEKYLNAAISGGRLCFIIFAVLCAVQGLIAFAFLRHLGPGIAGGLIEMLIYTLLARYYYKNAKLAES